VLLGKLDGDGHEVPVRRRLALGFLLLAVGLVAPAEDARAGEIVTVGRAGYQALPSLYWQQLTQARESDEEVVVVFTADWCSPCKTIKDLLAESPMVQRSVRDLRLLFIDVDEWRGPAHRLIAGAMPSKLPMLVRVDERGELVQRAMGTQMGLLSAETTSGNFRRLSLGQPPVRADYMDDSDKRTALARDQSRRRKARHAGVTALQVEVLGQEQTEQGGRRWTLDVTVRNLDARRRWFVLPGRLGGEWPAKFQAAGRETLRFTEHVRAHMLHFKGGHDLYVLPLASGSFVSLRGWIVEGGAEDRRFEVLELDRLKVAGEAAQFDKKVPYELQIADAAATRVAWSSSAPVDVELKVKQTLSAELNGGVFAH